MTTYIELHAIQSVPPSNLNRDDAGAPKSAIYGGVTRSRVSSQAWKHAIREDFSKTLDPKDVGTRSRMLVAEIAKMISDRREDLSEEAEALAVAAMEAAGFKKPVPRKSRAGEPAGSPETGYLVFMSHRQLSKLADAAIEASSESDPLKAMKAAKVKDLVDADHSIDIALFGRMIADSTDLNVDAACQVAHAISVHEAVPEYDFFTAVDDAKSRDEAQEDAGAGMMGTVGFVSATLYRYAVVNVDQLRINLGDADAVRLAVESFVRSFIAAMPSGKQNTFANGTRPSAVVMTVAEGQPTSLVGAFEKPIRSTDGYLEPAVKALASHAAEVFETWRTPSTILIAGTKSDVGELAGLGEVASVEQLITTAGASTLESV